MSCSFSCSSALLTYVIKDGYFLDNTYSALFLRFFSSQFLRLFISSSCFLACFSTPVTAAIFSQTLSKLLDSSWIMSSGCWDCYRYSIEHLWLALLFNFLTFFNASSSLPSSISCFGKASKSSWRFLHLLHNSESNLDAGFATYDFEFVYCPFFNIKITRPATTMISQISLVSLLNFVIFSRFEKFYISLN